MTPNKDSLILLVPPAQGRHTTFRYLVDFVAPNVEQVVLMGNMFDCPYSRPDEDIIWATHHIIAGIKKLKGSHPNFVWLLNKHDLPYWYKTAPRPIGYNTYTQRIIARELPLENVIQHFWMSIELHGWLLSSCGWSQNAGTEAHNILAWAKYAQVPNDAWQTMTSELLTAIRNGKSPWAVQYPKSLGGDLDVGGPLTGTWEELEVRPPWQQLVACHQRQTISEAIVQTKFVRPTPGSVVDVNYDRRNPDIGAMVVRNGQIIAYSKKALEKYQYNPALAAGLVVADVKTAGVIY